MSAKKWNMLVLLGTGSILFLVAMVIMIIDPFLHYHKPLECLEYPLKDERYQNDGLARWYEYDAVITGTSMTQNFKVSELNERMGVNAIKTSYSGASFHEISSSLKRTFEYNENLNLVLCSMDGSRILYPSNADEYEGYPEYLYNNNPFDDVEYLLNKEVLPKTIAVINYTRAGEKTPDMDEYGNWSRYKTFGKDAVLQTLTELPVIEEEVVLSEEDKQMAYENVDANLLTLAEEYEDTQFYFFIPPYSIVYWKALCETNQINAQIELEKIAVETMLQADNVHIYCFADRVDITSNLNNYTDTMHYSAEINSEMIRAIAEGENELTLENYENYYENIKKLYENFDYSSLGLE